MREQSTKINKKKLSPSYSVSSRTFYGFVLLSGSSNGNPRTHRISEKQAVTSSFFLRVAKSKKEVKAKKNEKTNGRTIRNATEAEVAPSQTTQQTIPRTTGSESSSQTEDLPNPVPKRQFVQELAQ